MHKKFLKVYLWCACCLLGVCAIAVILLDPFGYYHKPWFGLSNVSMNQVYQNPGYAKNYDYETALIGTSMTEGMRASEVDDLFETKTIKICQSGAYSLDIAQMLKIVSKEDETKTIILGLDANIFRKPYDAYRSKMPLYLYNNNIFDDIEYLFNKQVIFGESWDFISANRTGKITNIDDLYIRGSNNYSKEIALKNYQRGELVEFNVSWELAEKNIQNIEPYIRDNADITFYIYMPPYSMLFWDNYVLNNIVDEELEMQQKIVETFIKYDNVKFYYFMNDYEIISNLENYRDAGHYSPSICSEILEKMKNGEYLITAENYMQVFEEMESYIKEYNYDEIFMEGKTNLE